MEMAKMCGHLHVVHYLSKQGADKEDRDVNDRDVNDRTPLHHATTRQPLAACIVAQRAVFAEDPYTHTF